MTTLDLIKESEYTFIEIPTITIVARSECFSLDKFEDRYLKDKTIKLSIFWYESGHGSDLYYRCISSESSPRRAPVTLETEEQIFLLVRGSFRFIPNNK